MMKPVSKLLLIGNGYVGKIKSCYYTQGSTTHFINDLLNLGIDVSLFQFHKEIIENENILDSEIKGQLISTSFNDKNCLSKLISYLKIIFKLLTTIHKFKYIYVFYFTSLLILKYIPNLSFELL